MPDINQHFGTYKISSHWHVHLAKHIRIPTRRIGRENHAPWKNENPMKDHSQKKILVGLVGGVHLQKKYQKSMNHSFVPSRTVALAEERYNFCSSTKSWRFNLRTNSQAAKRGTCGAAFGVAHARICIHIYINVCVWVLEMDKDLHEYKS